MVTVLDLKADVKSYTWEVITENDDAVGAGALDKARLWLRARLNGAGIDFNPTAEDTDPVIARIIIAYALYQLYSYADQESVAADKKADALELIGAYISTAAAGDPAAARPAVGSVAKPEKKA